MAKVAKKNTEPSPEINSLWIGECSGALDWVFRNIQKRTPILRLESDREIESFGPSLHPSSILIAVQSRTSPLHQLVETASNRWPDAQQIVVLGEWWPGHRRCQPLHEGWTTQYWYELWDGILPRIQAEPVGVPSGLKLPPRVKRIVERSQIPEAASEQRLALITANDPFSRSLWSDLLPMFSILPIVRLPEQEVPYGDFQVAIVDLLLPPSGNESIDLERREIALVRARLPKAKLIVRSHFPRYDRWQQLERAGADHLLGSLFHLPGFAGLV